MAIGFRESSIGNINARRGDLTLGAVGNINIQYEDDFTALEDGVYVWNDEEFYFKTGDTFPDYFTQQRANMYKTADELYKTNLDDTYANVFSWNDMLMDIITNQQIQVLANRLPYYKICTEAWVDLLAGKAPRVDGDDRGKITRLSDILSNSNFAEAYRSVIRGAQIMYGNKVFRVTKLGNGRVKAVDVPTKCWIPFVSENDLSTIQVNVEFRITRISSVEYCCEFICYHETGKKEKYKFDYDPVNKVLGELVSHEELDNPLGDISPIVVFTGDSLNGNIYGLGKYTDWDASIASCIRAYETVMQMDERCKEIARIYPKGATQTDDDTGVTRVQRFGVIAYDDTEHVPEVKFVVPEVNMEQALRAYETTLERLAIDTGLANTFFNIKEIKSGVSGESLKTSMFRTERRSMSIKTNLGLALKELVYKMGVATGLDLTINDFSVVSYDGFVQNLKEQNEIITGRLANGTLSPEEAIMQYDDVPKSIASDKVKTLNGLPVDNDNIDDSITEYGGDNSKPEFTVGIDKREENSTVNDNGGQVSMLMGANINHVDERGNQV